MELEHHEEWNRDKLVVNYLASSMADNHISIKLPVSSPIITSQLS